MNQNRKENQDFINEYNIRADKQKNILLNLRVDDFCYSLINYKNGFGHEVLYVFSPCVRLFDINDDEVFVDIYIKFNILNNNQRVIVVSFHKLNKPIRHLFR